MTFSPTPSNASLSVFRPGSNNGLRAYLEKAIAGAISDAHRDWKSKGFARFDTRAAAVFGLK
jgi:hypothetical protein